MKNATFESKSLLFQLRLLLVVLGVSVVVLVARAWHMDGPDIVMDDAFISFRYSINLADGLGLVYNANERVEGYTNFLWTVLLAGAVYLGLEIVACSKILAMCAAIGTLCVMRQFSSHVFDGRPAFGAIASLPLILFAVMPSQARYAVSGMETLLFVFLVTLAAYLFYRRKLAASGTVFSLAAMTRPEGLMYFSICIGYGLVFLGEGSRKQQKTREFLIQFLGSFTLIYGLYFLWRYSYYGYLLPNTFYAKASGFSLARLERGWEYLREVVGFWSLPPLLITSLFALPSTRSNRVWLLFTGFSITTAVYFVYVGGDFVVWFGPRFLMPILPFIGLMAAEGILRLASVFSPLRWQLFFAWIFSLLLTVNGLWFSWPARFDRLDYFKAQMRSWRELGSWMKSNLPADTKIATDAAGLIPFYSNLYAIDMFGLTDEHIAHLVVPNIGAGIVAHEKFDPAYILRRKPDCIVSTWMDEKGRAVSAGLSAVVEQFEEAYELVAVAKVRYGIPSDDRWVIATSAYSKDLHSNGYQTGLFCLKADQPVDPLQGGMAPLALARE